MRRWRELNVLEVSLTWLNKYKDVIKYQDQDILNGIFKDDVKFINTRFNFTPSESGYIKISKKKRENSISCSLFTIIQDLISFGLVEVLT